MNDDMPSPQNGRSEPAAGAENTFLQPRRGPKRWPVLLILAAMLIVPALFWRQIWWGSPLSDEQLSERLSQGDNVRHVQHALEQLSRRIQEDPETARPLYPKVTALIDHQEPLVRSAAAWLMGEDNGHEPFRDALHRLLADAEPLVRYNAAVALSRFADDSGRPVLRKMLRPFVVTAAWEVNATSGTVKDVLLTDDPIGPLSRLALVDLGTAGEKRVLAPLGGRLLNVQVGKGQRIERGDVIASIAPNAEQVWAALRALYLVGRAEDLADVEQYVDPPRRFPIGVARQARATAAAIREREKSG